LIGLGWINGLGKGDWPAWVGAFGTVFTLAGTIVLATSADRERKKEHLALTLVSAAGLVVKFTSIHSVLNAVLQDLPEDDFPDDPWSIFAECVESIDRVGLWETQDLVPLVSLPNHAAANLAWALTRIHDIRAALRQLSVLNPLPGRIQDILQELSKQLKATIHVLDSAQRECVTFLVQHGFRDE
jgi:hypothetical protein